MKTTVEKHIILQGKCMHHYAEQGSATNPGAKFKGFVQTVQDELRSHVQRFPLTGRTGSGRSFSGFQCTQSDSALIDIIRLKKPLSLPCAGRRGCIERHIS
jgi:hypothetical protein